MAIMNNAELSASLMRMTSEIIILTGDEEHLHVLTQIVLDGKVVSVSESEYTNR